MGALFNATDFAAEAGYSVMRDAAFERIGFLNHHGSGLLVPLYEKVMVDRLAKLGDRLSVVLTTPALAPAIDESLGVLIADSPVTSFWRLHEAIGHKLLQAAPLRPTVIASSASVHPSAHVAEAGVEIGAGAVVGPQATIMGPALVGHGTVIGANVVIGAEGYQVARLGDRVINVPHLGGVRLGNRVDVQAGTVIDRSLWPGFTEIGDDTKIGGSCYIAHCCVVGERCRFMPRAVVCGSVSIGDDAVIGLGAIVSNGLSIGRNATVMISELVRRDIPDDMVQINGRFIDQRKFARMRALAN
jgi:UDP-3-O-[3-hydroxymyristoyl] glucosamine N-acyltransferase